MLKERYNQTYFNRILKIIAEENYEQALFEFQTYLDNYPCDERARMVYVDLLIKINRLEEAKQIIEVCSSYENKSINTRVDYIDSKIRLLVALKKYEEAYELFNNNMGICFQYCSDKRRNHFATQFLWLKKKAGLSIKPFYNDYQGKQLINYSDSDAIDHIIKKHSTDLYNNSIFDNNIDLEKIYYMIKSYLPHQIKINSTLEMTKYVFKYEKCGSVDGIPVDYIRVVAFPDSDQILTMYPYKNNYELPYCEDLSIIKEGNDENFEKTKEKVK